MVLWGIMGDMSSVKKNFSYNLIYQILTIGSALVVMPYIARTLGANQAGAYSFTFSKAQYFYMFAMLGLANYGSRSIASAKAMDEQQGGKHNVSRSFFGIFTIQLVTAILALGSYLLYTFLFVQENTSIAMIQSLYVASALFDINWFFFGLEEFKLTVIRNSIVKLCSISSIFLFVKKPEDVWLYTLIMALGFLISAMLLWPYVKRFVVYEKPTRSEILSHVKPNLVLFVPVIAISIYNVMDKIMIGSMLHSTAEVAFYEHAYKILEIPYAVINALGAVMLPKMSALMQKGETEEGQKYIEKSLQFIMLLSIAMSFGLAAVADTFAPLYFGIEFTPCIVLIKALAPIGIIKSWANVIRTQYLLPCHHDKVYVGSVLCGAALNVVANLLLIPRIGTLGAVVGTLIAEVAVMLYQTVFSAKELNIKKYLRIVSRYLPAGILMYVAVSFLRDFTDKNLLSLCLQIGAGALVYGGICILTFPRLIVIILNDLQQKRK